MGLRVIIRYLKDGERVALWHRGRRYTYENTNRIFVIERCVILEAIFGCLLSIYGK